MCCSLLLFDDAPVDGDLRGLYTKTWRVAMIDAPAADPAMCVISCCCLPCSQFYIRNEALGGDMSQYKCCQGYYDNRCFTAGTVGDQGNVLCMVLEMWCCASCAISSTRHLVMDTRDIMPDPCDNRIIRCNNALWTMACVCEVLGICFEPARHAAHSIEHIAHLMYLFVVSCMATQTHIELQQAKQEQQGQAIALNWDQVAQAQLNKQQDFAARHAEAQRQQQGQGQGQGAAQAQAPTTNPMSRGSDQPYAAMGDEQQRRQQ